MRRWMCRRSTSFLLSPAPRRAPPPPPPPPPWRESCTPRPARRGSWYRSWASSTWSLPSALTARWAKISKISIVRSMTGRSSCCSRLRIWRGESSWSKITASAPLFRTNSASSSSRPAPRQVAASGSGRFWVRMPALSYPAEAASSRSSSMEASISYAPVSTPASTARGVYWVSFSYMTQAPFLWDFGVYPSLYFFRRMPRFLAKGRAFYQFGAR